MNVGAFAAAFHQISRLGLAKGEIVQFLFETCQQSNIVCLLTAIAIQ
jgi:hypothetical protein